MELLVTFAIVATLAAVAVPAYSKYRIRGKVATMVAAGSAAEMTVVNDYFNQGYNLSTINYANNSQPFVTPSSVFISSIAISAGVITVTGNTSELGGRAINITLTPTVVNNDFTWVCSTSSTYFEYAPDECRH